MLPGMPECHVHGHLKVPAKSFCSPVTWEFAGRKRYAGMVRSGWMEVPTPYRPTRGSPAPCRRPSSLRLFARLPRIMSFSSNCLPGYLIRAVGVVSGARWVL